VRRRRAVPHRVLVALVLLAVVAASACVKGKEPADTTAATGRGPGAAGASRLIAPATRSGDSVPGALAKPLDQYTPDEFYAFAHALPFGGGADKSRKCKGNPGCDVKAGAITSARVDAVDGQDSLTASALPKNGVVVIRAKNTGKYEEARYSMQPGDFEYFVVLRAVGSDSARWSMQQVSTGPGGRTRIEVASGAFVPCHHPFRKLENRANFYTCADSHMSSDSTLKMGQALQDALTEPIWLSCGMGCCVLG
jgi:hypothetical protein